MSLEELREKFLELEEFLSTEDFIKKNIICSTNNYWRQEFFVILRNERGGRIYI